MDKIKEKYNKFLDKFSIFENEKSICVDLIVIKEEFRNKGLGTTILKEIIKEADNQNKILTLTPSSDFGSNKTKLIKWYKSLGFLENKGKNKDFTISHTMYKEPKKINTQSIKKKTIKYNNI